MTGEDERSNVAEEEEDSELSFDCLVSDLRSKIITNLCESGDAKAEVAFDGEMSHSKNLLCSRHSHWSGERRGNWN